jgi:hypothetical protein
LADAFLDPGARLLVSDSDDGRAQLRLAHEALLTHWPRAKEQVDADARDLELRVGWKRRQRRGGQPERAGKSAAG